MKKISVSLSGHQTSITLEAEFITELKSLAAQAGQSVASIIRKLDETRDTDSNLSSAVRVWVLQQTKKKHTN